MKNMNWILCVVFIATTGLAAGKYGTAVTHGGKAKLSFHVLDDDGQPVDSATARVAFYFDPKKQELIIGKTDTNGLCTVEGLTYMDVSYQIEKDGYYRTEGRYVFGMVEPPVINNCWQPWDPTNTVVLKKIKNPVSMYVKRVEVDFPIEDKPVGFDLEKGDWVSPYGKGTKSDFILTFSRTPKTSEGYRATLKLDFSNQKDGIQKINSEPVSWMSLRLPHLAPELGYNTNSVYEMGYKPEGGHYGFENPDGDVNYFFRVRTVLNEQGEIKESSYGKIHGPIHVAGSGRDKARIIFQYYFNPTVNDRNLEFDPSKNLFGGRDRFAP
jgi:hypothetical protein